MSTETFIQIRRDLHQIPELGFAEYKTQQYILTYLATLPSERLHIKKWKTGLFVRIPGTKPMKCIGYRADIDGLPITEETTYPFRSKHEGYMHACGHDMHMAIALGILTYFVHHPISDDLLFIFQPAEESTGGALPMLKSKEFNTWKPDVIFALHIAPEYPVGSIATRPGILFANTSELFIDLMGTSGHAARPHLANDMAIAASELVLQLQSIISRNIDPLDSAVITIGKMSVGTVQNIISGHGRIEGTIRTLSLESMSKIKSRIQEIVKGIEHGFACQATIDWGVSYCQVNNEKTITLDFMNWVQNHTNYQLIECREAMTGEDFGYFLQEIPGMMFWLGVETPYSLHHPKIEPQEGAIKVGIETMTQYIEHMSNQHHM
ncbi:N-acetyldiaminopimelate deacetylase [Thermoflavimicrobium daqui]|uniref:N-acetyldiaminopimelate deacetylase n=1 Tax=Thermoflavimicrobium daqui TaxID=2137476 RepID=A0A364KA27_9BACL|nr:N-acetyldiaminopimelate deacetylase [Thermoflavimicrobium daqui]RAL27138.1 N-acetyldiaminopimelate deacetylase [Thermoflavimicrobium daqui]